MSLKPIKCTGPNCGKTDVFRMHKTGDWFWVRCARCGYHTSSYLTREKAAQAAKDGEHYISETGNKCIGVTKKEDRAALNDINMNCNACLRLIRVKRPKDKWGFLYGRCDSLEETPYQSEYGLIKFHPNDWMGMSCFINRDTGEPSDLAD